MEEKERKSKFSDPSNILTGVEEISVRGNQKLRFFYNNETEVYEDFDIRYHDSKLRCIEIDGDRYILIESPSQIHNIQKDEWLNFSRRIFLRIKNLSPFLIESEEEINFEESIFVSAVSFKAEVFEKVVSFRGAIFLKYISFLSARFEENANFEFTKFIGKANFSNASFEKKVSFHESCFYNNSIKASSIEGSSPAKTYFTRANFKDEVNFYGTLFCGGLELNNADIRILILDNIFFLKGTFKLKLSASQIDRISYLSENVIKDAEGKKREDMLSKKFKNLDKGLLNITKENVAGRETFLTLKNTAIKQNDMISALEFHKKEYDKYYSDLKWFSKSLGTKLILGFEKLVSNFGTSILRSVFWLFIFNGFMLSLYLLLYPEECKCSLMDNLDLWARLAFPLRHETFRLFNLAMLALNSVLLYEVIKSFRKFSRKL